MELLALSPRASEAVKRQAPSKRNRGAANKRPGPETEVDESAFASITADIVARERDAQLFPLPAGANTEQSKHRLLGSTSELLAYKGEAKGTAIAAPRTGR